MAHIMYGLPPGRTLAGVWMWIHDNTGGEQGRGKEMLLRSTLTGYQIGRIESSSHGNENIDEDYDFGFRIYNMARYQNLFQAALDKDGNLLYENDEDSVPFGPIERDLQSLLTGSIPRPEVRELVLYDFDFEESSDSGSDSDSEMNPDPPNRPSTPDSLTGSTVLQRDATTTSPGSSRPGTPPVMKLFIVSDVGYSLS